MKDPEVKDNLNLSDQVYNTLTALISAQRSLKVEFIEVDDSNGLVLLSLPVKVIKIEDDLDAYAPDKSLSMECTIGAIPVEEESKEIRESVLRIEPDFKERN